MDFSKMSDEEIDRLVEEKKTKQKQVDYSKLSDEEIDRLISEKTGAKPDEKFGGYEGLIRGGLNALPVAGGLLGGFVGTAAGPVGTVGGAGLGGMAGKSLQQSAEKFLFDGGPETRGQQYGDLATAGIENAAGEAGGQVLTKGIGLIGKGLKSTVPAAKEGSEEIIQAARSMGGEASPGMLSKSDTIKNLESSLEQSPTISGALVRSQKKPLTEGLKKASSEAVESSSSLSKYETGETVKNNLVSKIHEKLDPLAASYQNLEASTKHMALNPKSLDRISQGIRSHPLANYSGSPESQIANQFGDWVKEVKSVADIKRLRTMAGSRMSSDTISNTEKQVLGDVYDKLTKLTENQIKRTAVAQARTGAQGKGIGTDMISQLRETNKGYRALMELVEDVGGKAKLKSFKTPDQFLSRLDEIPSEQIGDKLFQTNNVNLLKTVKQEFPDVFESLRNSKLNELKSQIEFKGEVSPAKLLQKVKGMGKESRELLFGPDHAKMIDNIQTVVNSMPSKIGASDTPRGIEWANYLNVGQIGNETRRAIQYLFPYKRVGQQAVEKVGQGLVNRAGAKGAGGLVGQGLVRPAISRRRNE